MKSFLIPLAVLGAFFVGSTASAAVIVRAGPVRVAIRPAAVRAAGYAYPIYRPVVRPVVAAPAPLVAPSPAPVVLPNPSVTAAQVHRYRHAVREAFHNMVEDVNGH